MTSATMCRLVDALCELGLAERGPHPDHGGMVLVAATEKGNALMRAAAQRRIDLIARALHDLPASKQRLVLQATGALGELEERVRQRVRHR